MLLSAHLHIAVRHCWQILSPTAPTLDILGLSIPLHDLQSLAYVISIMEFVLLLYG